jgi:hypothetical protein
MVTDEEIAEDVRNYNKKTMQKMERLTSILEKLKTVEKAESKLNDAKRDARIRELKNKIEQLKQGNSTVKRTRYGLVPKDAKVVNPETGEEE